MNSNNENIKPLSLDEEDKYKPFSLDKKNNDKEADIVLKGKESTDQSLVNENTNVPITQGSTSDIKNKDSNYVFFFGVSASGKTVILSALLYYLSSKAGALEPQIGTPNTTTARVLLHDIFENIRQGVLPDRSTKNQVTRLDFVFIPNNKSKKVIPINLTFLETAGGNHQDIARGGTYHSSIDSYLNANIPLNIIIVTSYDTAERDDTLINEFLDELVRKGMNLKIVNVILVISKWDKSGRTKVSDEVELDDYIQERLPRTNERINTFGLNKTFFTIGLIEKTEKGEIIKELNLASAELLSKWLYESITGIRLDYEGTFWERIWFNL